jgi:RNA polymerase sigma-70 factor (sigma-E family)
VKTQPIDRDTSVDDALTALYHEHALRLTRLAYVMLGDRGAAEDIVQEAFAGLHRNWGRLADQSRAVFYLRSSVLNGCRDVLRRSTRSLTLTLVDELPDAPRTVTPSAESSVLSVEERQAVVTAIRQLPARQREALVLRFYLDEPEREIARLMGVRPGTVRSTTARALAALARLLEEES